MNGDNPLDLVFWTAAVRAKPFADQLRAAAAGGFTSFALPLAAYTALVDGGMAPAAIRRMAEDHGVPIRHIDVVTAWTPLRVPSGLSADLGAMFDTPMDRVREMIDTFDVASIVALGGFHAGELPLDEAIGHFAALCDEVANRGIVANIEFMPFWGIPDLASAWAIVKGAGRPNGGMMLDTWHFMRGDADFDLLRSIPGEHLTHIQLSDAPRTMAGVDLIDETLNHRRFPGDGDLPIVEILSIVAAKGHLAHVGTEVFSREADAMDWAAAGRRSGAITRASLSAAAALQRGAGSVDGGVAETLMSA